MAKTEKTTVESLIAERDRLEALLSANMAELQAFLPENEGKVFTIAGKPFLVVKSRKAGEFSLRQAVSDKVLAAMK